MINAYCTKKRAILSLFQPHFSYYMEALSELAATATATAKFLHHHVLKYRTSLATPLATVIAIAVTVYLDTFIFCHRWGQTAEIHTCIGTMHISQLDSFDLNEGAIWAWEPFWVAQWLLSLPFTSVELSTIFYTAFTPILNKNWNLFTQGLFFPSWLTGRFQHDTHQWDTITGDAADGAREVPGRSWGNQLTGQQRVCSGKGRVGFKSNFGSTHTWDAKLNGKFKTVYTRCIHVYSFRCWVKISWGEKGKWKHGFTKVFVCSTNWVI